MGEARQDAPPPSSSHASPSRTTILFVVEGFADGGAEGKLCELVGLLDRGRFRPIVCSLGLGEARRGEFERLGVDIHLIPKRARFVDWKLLRRLAALIRDEEVDIVQTTLFYADVAGAWAAARAGVRNVISWETVSSPKWLRWDRRLAYRWTQRWRRLVVAVSEETRRHVIEKRGIPESRVIVVPYGVDLTRFDARAAPLDLRAELGLPAGAKVLVTVARLVEEKAHRILLESAPRILAAEPETHFVFVGEGPLRPALDVQACAGGFADHVHLLGFRSDVPQLLPGADLFVLPSLYEGLPNAVLEAMAAGLPVVATAVDGTPEAVLNGVTGALVEPGDSEALAEAILGLLADPELRQRFGRAGRERVESTFDLARQVRRFEELYESLAPSR